MLRSWNMKFAWRLTQTMSKTPPSIIFLYLVSTYIFCCSVYLPCLNATINRIGKLQTTVTLKNSVDPIPADTHQFWTHSCTPALPPPWAVAPKPGHCCQSTGQRQHSSCQPNRRIWSGSAGSDHLQGQARYRCSLEKSIDRIPWCFVMKLYSWLKFWMCEGCLEKKAFDEWDHYHQCMCRRGGWRGCQQPPASQYTCSCRWSLT